jgi:hypothetical protein
MNSAAILSGLRVFIYVGFLLLMTIACGTQPITPAPLVTAVLPPESIAMTIVHVQPVEPTKAIPSTLTPFPSLTSIAEATPISTEITLSTATYTPTATYTATPMATLTPEGFPATPQPLPLWGEGVEACGVEATRLQGCQVASSDVFPCIYTTLPYDSYESIATMFYREVGRGDEIRNFNRASDGTYYPSLRPNMQLYIRDICSDYVITLFPICSLENAPPCWYQVKRGDNYHTIARSFFDNTVADSRLNEVTKRIEDANLFFAYGNKPLPLSEGIYIMIPATR